ncbi:MAG: hydrogenase nickel incorporation protein HypB [Candidatus Hydrothermae bacterium]|nr:hydrogenase nickel incorporation protein HypB [Candidatus Hydrothermae bacterium]
MKRMHVDVKQDLLRANDLLAQQLRESWKQGGTFVVNLLSSPGSGKTALLERTVEALKDTYRVLVLEGDLETERDAERIRARGVEAVQITTGGTCHLEAHMVAQVWQGVNGQVYDFVFIENVGNLVCPASYDLGEHLRVVLLSVPEGDDKPAKYPKAFRTARWLVLTKMDLLPHFEFDPDRAEAEARNLRPDLETFRLSARTGEGVEVWVKALIRARDALLERG